MAASPPIVTVVIPHLNQAAFLRRCLESLNAQTYPHEHFQIIVVDNGSRELPEAIVGSFANARLEQEPTPGPGPARNRGVAVSEGSILAFIDADCIADKRWLESIVAGFGTAPEMKILGGDVRIAVKNPKRLTEIEAYESVFQYRQEEYIRKFRFSGTGNLAVLRSDFNIVGSFGGIDISEDRDWGRRAIGLGYIIDYVPEMIVYHPARTKFSEVYEKWARHIDHDFAEYRSKRFGYLRWILYAAAVAASPLSELRRILSSPRISTPHSRWLAVTAVTRIRLYRSRRMIGLFFGAHPSSRAWNRN